MVFDASHFEQRKVRDSTKVKTSENLAKIKRDEEIKPKVIREPKPKVVFDQEEMLKAAVETEVSRCLFFLGFQSNVSSCFKINIGRKLSLAAEKETSSPRGR
jgi:hypothetical protein